MASFFVWSLVNGLQIRCKLLLVLICHILQCITDLMDDAALIFRIGKGCRDSLLDTGKSVCTKQENVLDASVLKAIQNAEPKLGTFIFTDLNCQDLFVAV